MATTLNPVVYLVGALALFGLLHSAHGEEPSGAGNPGAPATANIALELNKLENSDKGCRPFFVISNTTSTFYKTFKLDLVVFQSDGVIGRRFILDLAPVRVQKKSVKLFELDGMTCDKIGSFLINDVTECEADAGPSSNCLQILSVSARTNVTLSK